MAIKRVKVWSNPTKTDWRVYVETEDGREGCKYLTGNGWHAKGEIEGDLTAEDWTEAKKIAVWDRRWHTVYENEMSRYYGPDEDVRSDIEAMNAPRLRQSFDSSDMKIETGTV